MTSDQYTRAEKDMALAVTDILAAITTLQTQMRRADWQITADRKMRSIYTRLARAGHQLDECRPIIAQLTACPTCQVRPTRPLEDRMHPNG